MKVNAAENRDRVRAALDRLVGQGVLSPDQVEPVTDAVAEAMGTPASGRPARWAEIVSYTGGALVLAGGAALVATSWQDMTRALRIGTLGLITLLLLIVAVWAAGGPLAITSRHRAPRDPRAPSRGAPSPGAAVPEAPPPGAPAPGAPDGGASDAGASAPVALDPTAQVAASPGAATPYAARTRPVDGRHPAGSVRHRVASVTWALASGTAALGAGEIQDVHQFLIASTVGLVVALAGYVCVPGAVGLLAVAAFGAATLEELLDLSGNPPDLLVAMATITLGGLFALLGSVRVIPHRGLALGIGAALALIGAQWPISGNAAWAYALTLAVGICCLAAYARERAWVLIVAGVVGVTLAVPEAIWDWTDGTLSGGLMIVVTGFVLLGAGAAGLALHRMTAAGHPEGTRPPA